MPSKHLLITLILSIANAATAITTTIPQQFKEAPQFYNSPDCPSIITTDLDDNNEEHIFCSDEAVHVAMTLDTAYIRGSMAAILSVLQHSSCPQNIAFHFVASAKANASFLRAIISTSFPYLKFQIYPFDDSSVSGLISTSIRSALDCPLNYARSYLANLLPLCVRRVVYLDSDLVLVDDIAKLAATDLGNDSVLAAPEYCNANFTWYFTPSFWSNHALSETFANRKACYFNTGVMVIDLERWREGDYTKKIEEWMELQKRMRIYELGSLPPFLLVFAGNIVPVDHRWNQHGLGGDNFRGLCRDLHTGPVSLLHWSGKGKPWVRLDANRPCPLDALWAPWTKKEKRKIALQIEFGSRVEKKKQAFLPLKNLDLKEYLTYKEAKLAQLNPLVLQNPSTFSDAKVSEEDSEAEDNVNTSSSERVPPKNPKWAVYGRSLDDVSDFFNSGIYEPPDKISEGPRRKLFTNDEKALLNKKLPDLATATSEKWLPLHTLAASGEFYFVDTLLKHNVDINAVNKNGLTALHKAIIGKKLAVTNYILRESANPFVLDEDGATLLHYAVRTASSPAIKILLLYNVDINLQDNDGWTPLHLAVQARRTDIVKLLLIKGADKTLKNRDGSTPLDLCLYSGRDTRTYEMIKLLKQLPKSQ